MGAEVTPEKITEITYTTTKQVEKTISHEDAQEFITHCEEKGYISKSGVIKNTMKEQLAAGTLDIPTRFEAARYKFETIIRKANSRVVVNNKDKKVTVKLKKQVMVSPEFLALWDKIKGKTSYRVTIDESMLINRCIEELVKMDKIPKAKIVTRTARMNVEHSGISHTEIGLDTSDTNDETHRLPDFLRMVDNECFMSHKTIANILFGSRRLKDFLNNPQKFSEMFIDIVKRVLVSMKIDGIKYHKLAGEEYFLLEIFDKEELDGYLDHNAISVENSVYDHVVYDSDTVELPFAKALNEDKSVKMFFKIPPKFKIETPIGTYNPDWAVYMDKDGEQKFYFVIETKGTTTLEGLRSNEKDKIRCGMKHFAALDSGVVFPKNPVKEWLEFKKNL